MGFETQLREVIHRLDDKRQTVLFSATLPKGLVEFAKAGLHNPTLIRLDVDSKLSPNLQVSDKYQQCVRMATLRCDSQKHDYNM